MSDVSNSKKRIGILTFLHTLNYGALFQAYALEKVLLDAGFEAVQIDYRNPRVEAFEYKLHLSLKGRIANVIRRPIIRRKEKAFDIFRRSFIPSTAPVDYDGLARICDSLDCIIVGSDQVWNGAVTGFDSAYFLDFIDDSRKKRTYAVSIGQDELLEKPGFDYKDLVSGFPSLLVREKTAVDSLKKEGVDKEIEVVLDPTFLLDSFEWRLLADEHPIKPNKGYVFVYAVGETKNTVAAAQIIARHKGLEVVVLQQNGFLPIPGVTNLFSISPKVFLSYLARAECVVTSSFHGTCLAIQFERDFFVSLATGGVKRNSRMLDLLETLNLSDRVLSGNPLEKNPIVWKDIRDRIACEKNRSLKLLFKSLESV